MELVNIYPIFSSDFLSRGIKGPMKNVTVESSKLKSHAFNYPYTLKPIYNSVIKTKFQIKEISGNVELVYFSDGIFCLTSSHEISSLENGIETLIAIADDERKVISDWLSGTDATNLFQRIYSHVNYTVGENEHFKLGFAYSHNIFHDNMETVIKKCIISDKWLSTSNEFVNQITSEPAVNLIDTDQKNRDEIYDYLQNLTMLMASLYEIQEVSVKTSRELIQNAFKNENLDEVLSKIAQRIGYFDQYLAELRLVDFLSDPFEELLGKTTAVSWDWNNLIKTTEKLVQHLGVQVEKLNDEFVRRSDIRTNKILFAFTFLTVLDVTGNLIALYDVGSLILPWIRILAVVSAMVFAVLVSRYYLKKSS